MVELRRAFDVVGIEWMCCAFVIWRWIEVVETKRGKNLTAFAETVGINRGVVVNSWTPGRHRRYAWQKCIGSNAAQYPSVCERMASECKM